MNGSLTARWLGCALGRRPVGPFRPYPTYQTRMLVGRPARDGLARAPRTARPVCVPVAPVQAKEVAGLSRRQCDPSPPGGRPHHSRVDNIVTHNKPSRVRITSQSGRQAYYTPHSSTTSAFVTPMTPWPASGEQARSALHVLLACRQAHGAGRPQRPRRPCGHSNCPTHILFLPN